MNSLALGATGVVEAPLPSPPLREIAPLSAPIFAGRLGSGWAFEVYDRVEDLGAEFWEAFFPAHWKDHRYYRTLEETFSGEFPQRYLVLREQNGTDPGPVRAVQPLFFVEQDLTVSLANWVRAALRPLRRWLRMRLMMVGCIVGEAQTGLAEAATAIPPRVVLAMAKALEAYARHEGISIVLLKDFPVAYRDGLHPLTASGGYTRLPSLPGVRLPLDFASFDDYVQSRLGKATRKNLRRKFREVDALPEPVTLEVKTSVTEEEAAALHTLYERVALRGDVHFEVFTKEYFLSLGQRMPEQTRYFIWRHAGQIVAFSFCTVHGGAIYDNDIGVDEDASPTLHLYHLTFRDIIRWALAQGLECYYSAPFSYDPKLHLRMELVPLDLYARHLSPVINFFLRRLAPLAAPTRQEPLLRQFPNAGDL